MNCAEVEAQLLDYLEQELEAEQASAVKAHLADCLSCCQARQELEATLDVLADAGSACVDIRDLSSSQPATVQVARPPERLERLGEFFIVGEIGRGGMGVVYEAVQQSLNRRVALKVLSSGLGLSKTAVVRFHREARAAAKLHHTNIVPIYATGQEGDTHFYAMELIDGPSLNFVIRQLRALGHPEAPTRRPGTARNVFSAAPAVDDDTQTVVRTGPPPQAPETADQDADREASSSSAARDNLAPLLSGGHYFDNVARLMADVADALDHAHSQGVIHRDIKPSNLLLSPDGKLSINDFGLARLLEQPGMTITGECVGTPQYMSPEQISAGRAPLDHRTDIYSLGATLYELLVLQPPFSGQRPNQIIAQIIHRDPTTPRRLNKRVPIDLDTICLKAMEKDPGRRYQSAGQLAEDLRRFVNRYAISAKRAGPMARLVKWARRRPAVAALATVVFLVSVAAGLLAYRSHLVAEKARRERGQTAMKEALVGALMGRYDVMEGWLEKAEVLDVDPGRLRVLRGLAAVEQGDIEAATHQLELAAQQLPESPGAHALLLRVYLESGRMDEVADLRRKIEKMQPVTLVDYLYGGWALGSVDQGMQWLEKLATEERMPAVYQVLGTRRFYELTESYDPGGIDETLAFLASAKTQMPGNVRAIWEYSGAHLVAADIYKLRNDPSGYEEHLNKAKQEVRRLLEQHPDRGESHIANAQLAVYEGRWEDAVAHLQTAKKCPGHYPPSLNYLPPLLYRLGRYQQALAELKAMPEGAQAMPLWCLDYAFIATELHGVEAGLNAYRQWLGEHRRRPDYMESDLPYQIYCLAGRPDQAIQLSRELTRKDEPNLVRVSLNVAARKGDVAARDYVHAATEYVCDRRSARELLAAASKRPLRLHAHYLIGLRRLAEGDRAAALEHFAEVARAGSHVFTDMYQSPWSHLLYDRLNKDPTWPPWIPPAGKTARSE